MADLRQGDYGVIVRLTVQEGGSPVDVSTATNSIIAERPKGAARVFAASFLTDGTDGIIEYTLLDGDLNEAGPWRVRARCVFVSGLTVHSTALDLNVEAVSAQAG